MASRSYRRNAPIRFEEIDLRGKYDDFNRRFFDGALPSEIKLSFGKMKGATGMAGARAVRAHANALARFGQPLPPGSVTGFRITMSTLLKYEDAEFDRFFLHEMCHVAMFAAGWAAESHGRRWQALAVEIGRKAGLEIPKVHALTGTEEINGRERVVGALLAKMPDKRELFSLFDPSPDNRVAFIESGARFARYANASVAVHVLPTKAWAVTTVQRKPNRRGLVLWPLTERVSSLLGLSAANAVASFGPGDALKP